VTGAGDPSEASAIAVSWLRDGRRVARALLVEALGSTPLDPGAAMYIDADGAIEGSVTGGCVEAALAEECAAVLAGGEPRVREYGISDDVAAGVGLMCGGTVRILVSELRDARDPFIAALAAAGAGEPAALATVLDGPQAGAALAIAGDAVVGALGGPELLDRSVEREVRGALAQGISTLRRFGSDGRQTGGDVRVWIEAYAPPARLVILGAIDYSVALARAARLLGFRTTICDARGPFIASARFAEVAEVVVDWPDRYLAGQELTERDAVLVFTHDPKFDEPALREALASGAGYVGAMGSRRTQRDRRERLLEAGVSEASLARLAAPCGLDIGARRPEETAVSILGEIIARRTGRRGDLLADTSGPIRGERADLQAPVQR
jgi:xanthine dehydrogenase accessory factor